MKTPHRRARELAVQALYQAAINDIPTTEAAKNVREMAEFNRADEGLFNRLVIGTADNAAAYMQQIRPLLDHDEKGLSPIERTVLSMACHELSAMPGTPYPVITNEAIEVTRTFGGTNGHRSINGILDRLTAQLRPDNPKRGA